MVWDAVQNLWFALQATARENFKDILGNASGLFKLALFALILFLIAWIVILQRKAHVLDTERRAQQVRAQAAERNGLKLAPLGDNSLPDPKHGSDKSFWKNFFLLSGAVLILGFLAHRYYAKPPKFYDYGPVYAEPVYKGPISAEPAYAGPAYPTYAQAPAYAPPPMAAPAATTVWLGGQKGAIQPASQRVVETRPAPETPKRTAADPLPGCGGGPIPAGRAAFFIRGEAATAPRNAKPDSFWSLFDAGRAEEAKRFYDEQDRPAMLRAYGARSQAAAYNANNLAVALFHTGECARAEAMFREARDLAKTLGMPQADQARIDQNYAHFRALKAVRG